ncbi:hypothetical protein [Mesobacterium pallidum]|uniref:hypothetical protein n=1 Tax=Mesobacterium pallidum TaxID=2872037 RepID=UPI001EE2CE64|nr:hypothetical protein [Mesobacterium pallidum]
MMRISLGLVMAAIVALTAQTAAMARGQAPATDRIVLCIGLGTATVYLDEDGAPTGAPHICPDALLGFADALLPQPLPPVRLERWVALAPGARTALLAAVPVATLRARGPPVA